MNEFIRVFASGKKTLSPCNRLRKGSSAPPQLFLSPDFGACVHVVKGNTQNQTLSFCGSSRFPCTACIPIGSV